MYLITTTWQVLLQVRVAAPSQKMARKLPGGWKLTTPAPHVLAGIYQKALGAGAPTADTIAGTAASALNARYVLKVCSWDFSVSYAF